MTKLANLFTQVACNDGTRQCGTCGEVKPVSEFYKDGRDSKGNIRYRRDCKECYKMTRLRESRMKERS